LYHSDQKQECSATSGFLGLELWKRLLIENGLQDVVNPSASRNNFILQAHAAFFTRLNFPVEIVCLEGYLRTRDAFDRCGLRVHVLLRYVHVQTTV